MVLMLQCFLSKLLKPFFAETFEPSCILSDIFSEKYSDMLSDIFKSYPKIAHKMHAFFPLRSPCPARRAPQRGPAGFDGFESRSSKGDHNGANTMKNGRFMLGKWEKTFV